MAQPVFNTESFSEILFYIVRSTFTVEDISRKLCCVCGVYLIQIAQCYRSDNKENFVFHRWKASGSAAWYVGKYGKSKNNRSPAGSNHICPRCDFKGVVQLTVCQHETSRSADVLSFYVICLSNMMSAFVVDIKLFMYR